MNWTSRRVSMRKRRRPDALAKGRPFTRPHRWRPLYKVSVARVIEGETYPPDEKSEPSFLSKLERHLAWHLVRLFLMKHPIVAAQLGFSAFNEAARLLAGELGGRYKSRKRDL